MKILKYSQIEEYVPILEKLLVLGGIFFTSVFLFKNLPYQDIVEKKVALFYNVPMIFLLFIWLKNKIKEREIVYLQVISVDTLVLFLVWLRMFGLLYHSGHVLFLVYSFFTTKNTFYRVICVAILVVTGYFKFLVWSDFITPFVGVIMALFFVWVRNRVKNR